MVSRRIIPHRAVKASLWILGVILLLLLTVFAGSFLFDRPLRGYMEQRINRNLNGYTVTLDGAHFQPIDFALTLKGVAIMQDANPDPPVADFPVFRASLNWTSLIRGRVVGELRLDRPRLHVDLTQLRHETARKFPVRKVGWQRAFEAIYPLKINRFIINDGDVKYIDEDPGRPLHITGVNALATNIRNIVRPGVTYPSPLHLEGVIFGRGRLSLDGHANFLEEPFAGVKVSYTLSGAPLEDFKPVLSRVNMDIKGGLIASTGELEYSPRIKAAHVKELAITGVHMDYVHSPETIAAEKARVEMVKEAAKEVKGKPGLLMVVDRLRVSDSELGYIDETKDHPYRAYVTDLKLEMTNLSNKPTRGAADVSITGKFMGSGHANATASFRPAKQGADFDLKVEVNDTELRSMNDILLAYGDFDVESGSFSMIVDAHVKEGEVSGYIKPFFKDMDVYDKRSEREKSLFHKLYVRIVELAAGILENPEQDTVATKITITGEAGKIQTSTWQIMTNLVRHAFFNTFLPEFDEAVTNNRPKPAKAPRKTTKGK